MTRSIAVSKPMTDIAHPQYKMSVPGLGVGGAIFLAKHNPVAVGADTFSTEVIPWEDKDTYFPVHLELMPKRGIYNLENMVTRERSSTTRPGS